MRTLVSRIVFHMKGARRACDLLVDVGCAHRNLVMVGEADPWRSWISSTSDTAISTGESARLFQDQWSLRERLNCWRYCRYGWAGSTECCTT